MTEGRERSTARSSRSRVTIEEQNGNLLITIPARRRWFHFIFFGIWLVGWAIGEVVVAVFLPITLLAWVLGDQEARGDVGFLGPWFTAWTLGGFFFGRGWIWQLSGRELLTLNNEGLTVTRITRLSKRARHFPSVEIRNMRADAGPLGPVNFLIGAQWADWFELWGFSGGRIAIDLDRGRVNVGAGASYDEAQEVVAAIKERYPTLIISETK